MEKLNDHLFIDIFKSERYCAVCGDCEDLCLPQPIDDLIKKHKKFKKKHKKCKGKDQKFLRYEDE